MSNSIFSIFSGKYFNQNLICLIIAYIGVYFACKEGYCCLCHICLTLSIVSLCSLLITICFYTYEYCVKRVYKSRSHKLRYEYNVKLVETSSLNKDVNGKQIIEW